MKAAGFFFPVIQLGRMNSSRMLAVSICFSASARFLSEQPAHAHQLPNLAGEPGTA